jgi:hypothetical protein
VRKQGGRIDIPASSRAATAVAAIGCLPLSATVSVHRQLGPAACAARTAARASAAVTRVGAERSLFFGLAGEALAPAGHGRQLLIAAAAKARLPRRDRQPPQVGGPAAVDAPAGSAAAARQCICVTTCGIARSRTASRMMS